MKFLYFCIYVYMPVYINLYNVSIRHCRIIGKISKNFNFPSIFGLSLPALFSIVFFYLVSDSLNKW